MSDEAIRAAIDFPAESPLIFRRPRWERESRSVSEVPALLAAASSEARAGRWVVCFVAYDAAPAFDRAMVVPGGQTVVPLAWIGSFDSPEPTALPAGETRAWHTLPDRYTLPDWNTTVDRAEFSSAVRCIREAIERGDVYQVNHTIRLRARFSGDPLAFHRALCASQGTGYSAYIDLGDLQILSASPELFFRLEGRSITTRPMKGTARRGRWLEEDDSRIRALSGSAKDRAENVMIVDLLRNDLGRVAIPGTVRVPSLFEVERYRTVLQATSTVTATLRDDVDLPGVFKALFPCGSVTGAPKIAAMRMIAGLEASPRQAYCGAIGLVRPGGDATFNVAIRTVTVDRVRGIAEYGTGGGITWDSRADGELDEVAAKAAILTQRWPVFELLETMLLEKGEYPRLGAHLERLGESAAYFGFVDPVGAARSALAEHSASHEGPAHRVRLLAGSEGNVRLESEMLEPLPTGPLRVALAAEPVSSRDPFLCHKTSNRRVYERARASHPEAFDVLLWNERGEVTEYTIGNLVAEVDGGRFTPPRAAGLLAGTFRAELLRAGDVRERTLLREDVRRARRLWLVNSVRDWVEVELDD